MTRRTHVGLLALICAAATIWLLPSASLGEGGDANRLDGALKRTTQQLAAAVQQAVAPVTSGVQSTLAKTQSDLEATRRALQRARQRAAARAAATDPARQPPLHGTNSHGQGGVATVDLNPSNERPLGPSTDGSDSGPEDVVVGRARGEQTASGAYHGHITILALFGNDLLGVDSAEGETKNGPLQPLQTSVLDPLCTSTNGQVCLSVLTANSTTTDSGSQNDFALARASIVGLGVGAAESGGASGETKDCQTSVGTSKTANVATAGGPVAGVANSGTSSQSCRGQAAKVASSSQVVALGGNGIPLPASGCDNGTADTLVEIPLLAKIVCNADEAVGAALVRDALDVFAINSGTSSLVRESTAASEALSVAPSGPETPGPACSDGVDNDGDGVADGADPGCHSDGDAKNPSSYNPSDTSEEDESPNEPSGENGKRECSDNKDNDGDKKVDEDDPGCHSDGNPNNPSSYNPRDDDESDDGGGDNGGGGGGGGDNAKPLSASGLPLTGSNVLGLALSGLLVLAGGLLLRRREGAHPGA